MTLADKEEPEAEDIVITVKNLDKRGQKVILTPVLARGNTLMNSYKIFTDTKLYKQLDYLRFQLRLMYWSAHFNNTKFVEYFMKRKCSPFVECFDGYTTLHKAAERGSFETL